MEGLQYGIQQGYNPMTMGYGSQPYGGQAPFGSGIPGLFGGQNFGRQQGQPDGITGMLQGYGTVDPITAAHIQQHAQLAQLVQQVQLAQQQAQLAQQLGQQQQFGRQTPLGLDPVTATILQQRLQQVQQNPQWNQWGNLNSFGQLGRLDPITAAIQHAQAVQVCQHLALQAQLGQQQNPFAQQQNPFGQQQSPYGQQQNPFGQQGLYGQQGHAGFGQQTQGWLGGQNPWTSQQFGRTNPFQYGGQFGGQLPLY
jgi:hypothetical protein